MRMAVLEKHGAAISGPPDAGLAEAVLDPYVNAIHVSLLREKRLNPEYREALTQLGVGRPEVREFGERMLTRGPEAISPMNDPGAVGCRGHVLAASPGMDPVERRPRFLAANRHSPIRPLNGLQVEG